jgi:hypothetical protein
MLKNYSLYSKLNESGIRDIKKIAKKWNKANIYFHVDLDGVTSAIAMKKYLEQYGIKTTKFHTIQYGEKEYDLVKPEKDALPVLVDMSSGKIEFKIHTDHHEDQKGVGEETSTIFKTAKSNASIISDQISPNQIFPNGDIEAINMIDSASFAEKDIMPEDIIKFKYDTDKGKSAEENRLQLSLVVNKLLLAFKNKPKFLEQLVEKSEPNMLSMYNNILDLIVEWNKKAWFKQRLSQTDNLEEIITKLVGYSKEYVEELKSFKGLVMKNNILMQYDAPKMYEPGKFDRYSSFSLYPESDFFIMVWTMGLIQCSKNPFKKKTEAYNEVHLGEIARSILDNHKDDLEEKKISVKDIKQIAETSIQKKAQRKFNPELNFSEKFGLRWEDLVASYGIDNINNPRNYSEDMLKSIMSTKALKLSPKQKEVLDSIYITAWDIISKSSGGHKGITNLSGFNYLSPNGEIKEGDYSNKLIREISRELYFRLNDVQEKIKNLEK